MKKKLILSILAVTLMMFAMFPSTVFAARDVVSLAVIPSGSTVSLSSAANRYDHNHGFESADIGRRCY